MSSTSYFSKPQDDISPPLYSLSSLIIRTLKSLGYSMITASPRALKFMGTYPKSSDISIICKTPRNALSMATGAAILGCRAAIIIDSVELFLLTASLRELMFSGVRGSLLLLVLPISGFDSRLVVEGSFVPLIEPLEVESIPKFLDVASDLSEALEVPFLFQLPDYDFIVKIPFLPCGIKSEPIFSKHWEFPYRWINPSFTRNNERIDMLDKVYERLIEAFEWNIIPEDIKGMPIVTFGLCYSQTKALIEDYVDKKYSLIGISLHTPTCILKKPPKWLSRISNSSDNIVVIERGEPLLERYLGKILGYQRIQGKNILGANARLMGSSEITRCILNKVLKKCSPSELLSRDIKELIKPHYPKLPHSIKMLSRILEFFISKIKDIVIVNSLLDDTLRLLIEGVLISRVSPDYDVRSRKYPIRIPSDVIDVSYDTLSPIMISKGQISVNFHNPVVAIISLKELVLNLEELENLYNVVILILEPHRIVKPYRVLLRYLEKERRLVRIPIWEGDRLVRLILNYFRDRSKRKEPLLIFLLGSSFG